MIVCIGNPVYDYIETPQVRTVDRVLSGCAVNAGIVLCRMGYTPVVIYGSVGPDYQQDMQERIKAIGGQAIVKSGKSTGGFGLYYDDTGHRTMRILGVANVLDTQDVERIRPLLTAASFVLLGPILQEISPDFISQVRHITEAPILLDPQGCLRRIEGDRVEHFYDKKLDSVLPMVDIIKANEVETLVMTGFNPRTQGLEAVWALHSKGCQIAIVTVAEKGSLICDGKSVYTIPAYAVSAVDPTGAGDTYAAGIIISILEGIDNWQQRGCFASAIASMTVEYVAATAPYSWLEVRRRFFALVNGGGNQNVE